MRGGLGDGGRRRRRRMVDVLGSWGIHQALMHVGEVVIMVR